MGGLAMLPQVDMVEAVDRTVEWLTNRLGRSPTIEEVAEAAGVGYDEVLTALDASRPLAGMHARTALYLRCVEGLDRKQIAERLGVRCAEVSRLLRATNLSAGACQERPQAGAAARHR
jgi:DNA-directed RNA polymerase specialized sigma subunit